MICIMRIADDVGSGFVTKKKSSIIELDTIGFRIAFLSANAIIGGYMNLLDRQNNRKESTQAKSQIQ